MWCAVFLGLATVAFADQTSAPGPNKRYSQGSNVVIYGSSPRNYVLQEPDSVHQVQGSRSQLAVEAQQYVNKKAEGAVLSFVQDRPQHYISNVRLGGEPDVANVQHQVQQSDYDQPTANLPQRVQQHRQRQQFASSGIVDAAAGSFEEELAQLVAANRAQEHHNYHNSVNSARKHIHVPSVIRATTAAPQQYLKEITRPVTRPVSDELPQRRPTVPLYRYVYEPESRSSNRQVAEPAVDTRYVAAQDYIGERELAQLSHPLPHGGGAYASEAVQASHIPPGHGQGRYREETAAQQYSLQREYLIKPRVSVHDATETAVPVPVPVSVPVPSNPTRIPAVRIPGQKGKPLTQEEFHRLLQLGGYTATLLPSSHNSPTQEYLLQAKYPAGQEQLPALHNGNGNGTGNRRNQHAPASS